MANAVPVNRAEGTVRRSRRYWLGTASGGRDTTGAGKARARWKRAAGQLRARGAAQGEAWREGLLRAKGRRPATSGHDDGGKRGRSRLRSEEHTSELQSLRHLVCRL